MLERTDEIVEFSGLADRIHDPVYLLDRNGRAAAVLDDHLLRPDVLALDEGIGAADAAFSRRADERLAQFMSAAGPWSWRPTTLPRCAPCARGVCCW
jgi:ABC-type polysaccharide/polyol phosphate transport system ATPase subunit